MVNIITSKNRQLHKLCDRMDKQREAKQYKEKPLDPIYRDMQKETDRFKYKNRRELKLKYY